MLKDGPLTASLLYCPAGKSQVLMVAMMITESSEVTLPLTQKTLDSLGIHIKVEKFIDGDIRKPISVPGTFTKQKRNQQGFINILQAPVKGIYDSIDIILFILIIGGFMFVFNETGAMVKVSQVTPLTIAPVSLNTNMKPPMMRINKIISMLS